MAPVATESYAETVGRLASAQKARGRGAPAYSILVNRRVGRYLAAWAYRRGLTPNGVTAISATFTFSAILAIALAPPSWGLGLAVWLGLALGYAFDSADGQVARLRGGGSPAGEWLDHVVDCVKISSLHLAVLVAAYRFFELPSPTWLLVPIGFTLVATTSFFTLILNDLIRRAHAPGSGRAPAAEGGSLVRSLLVSPTDYGVLCLTFLTLGAPTVFFAVYTVLFLATTTHLVLAEVKWFRDMLALGGSRPM